MDTDKEMFNAMNEPPILSSFQFPNFKMEARGFVF